MSCFFETNKHLTCKTKLLWIQAYLNGFSLMEAFIIILLVSDLTLVSLVALGNVLHSLEDYYQHIPMSTNGHDMNVRSLTCLAIIINTP